MNHKGHKEHKDKSVPFFVLFECFVVIFSPMLRDAVAKGYKDAAHMKEDKDLDPLRQRGDFKKLLAELEGKGKAVPKP